MMREQKNRKRHRQKRRNIVLLTVLTLLLVTAVGVFVVLHVFTVENVIVEGNEVYSSKQIQDMVLNDDYSWNSLYVDLKYRLFDVGDIPFVDTMEISLDDPHTLRISVYEKGILGSFYIEALGQYAYFDKDGFVVETSSDVIEGVPRITGIACDTVVLYEKLPLEKEQILSRLLTLTQMLKKYDLAPEQIFYDSTEKPILTYQNIEVVVGTDEYLAQKIVRLSAILPQLSGLSGTLRLDSWTPDTTDIVFKRSDL